MQYRAEIDGLRAVAVLPVLLFHSGSELFGGGFVGVDVFFVISGYLITGIILEDRKHNRFNLTSFYQRRARRILPALFTMLFVVSLAYLFFGRPSQQEAELLTQSVLSSTFFYSNIYFWQTTGYFATSTELLPFIHTWSLAVEEQYYILFPIFLMACWRLGKHWVVGSLIVIFACSLMAAHLGVQRQPMAAFYLLPTRGWEILLGAFTALYLQDRATKSPVGAIDQFGAAAGLLMVFYAILAFDAQTPFPSLHTLIPTLGVVLIILFAVPGTLVNALLGHRLLTSIGLISYSLYLWHQPLLAFSRNLSVHPEFTSTALMAFALTAAFVLAYLSYRFVERPFRKGTVGLVGLIPLGIALAASTLGLQFLTPSVPWAAPMGFSSASRDLARDDYDCLLRDGDACYFGKSISSEPDVILLGNSHAKMYISTLSDALVTKGLSGMNPGAKLVGDDDLAVKDGITENGIGIWMDRICPMLKTTKYTIVSYRYTNFFTGRLNYFYENHPVDMTLVNDRSNRLGNRLEQIAHCSENVIVIGPAPEAPDWGPNIARSHFGKRPESRLQNFLIQNQLILDMLSQFDDTFDHVSVVYPHTYHCDVATDTCRTTHVLPNGEALPLYYDDDHFGRLGSQPVVDEILEIWGTRDADRK